MHCTGVEIVDKFALHKKIVMHYLEEASPVCSLPLAIWLFFNDLLHCLLLTLNDIIFTVQCDIINCCNLSYL